MASSPATDNESPLDSAAETRAAVGPISLVTRIIGRLHQSPTDAETLNHIANDIGAATGATLVCVQQDNWNAAARVSTIAEQDWTTDLDEAVQAASTAAPSRPAARPAANVFGPTARALSCASPCGQATLLVVVPQAADIASETAWLRSLELIVNQLATRALDANQANRTALEPSNGTSIVTAVPDFSSFHRSLTLRDVASTIANDSRTLLQVDRVSVLIRTGRKYRTVAVSGCSKVHRRSNVNRALERLARVAAVTKETFDYPERDETPPQIQAALDRYLDESLVDQLRLVPLFESTDRSADPDEAPKPRRRPMALLVLENLSSGAASSSSSSGNLAIPDHYLVSQHAGRAIENAQRHGRVFLLPIWEMLGGLFARSRILWTLLATVLLLGLAAAAVLIQVDHYVVAEGTLQPLHRQHVFAPIDGVVQTIHVKHGQTVDQDTLLVTLQSAELERQIEETIGQIQTASRQRSAVLATRLANSEGASTKNLPFDSMASEEQQLDAEIKSLEKQLVLLQSQAAGLEIRSPLAGQIVSWDLTGRIGSRPVSRGHQLLTIGNIHDAWMLDLQLPDEDTGVVNAAKADSENELLVRYALATEPERIYAATLSKVAESASDSDAGQTIVPVEAMLPTETPHARRVGAEVRAKIYCGRRSLGASWFSDVARAFRKHVLFHFRRAES